MSEPDSPLPEPLRKAILKSCTDESVLVGGQAVLVWAWYFEIDPNHTAPAVTRDIDFVGTSGDAEVLAKAIGGSLKVATMDDHTPETAIVAVPREDSEHPAIVDFLGDIEGVSRNEVLQNALRLEYEDISIKVIHPIDSLISRIANLHRFKGKQTPEGIAQTKLSTLIAHAWIEEIMRNGDFRPVSRLLEKLISYASQKTIKSTLGEFGVDILEGFPLHKCPQQFQEKRWPQLVELMS